MNFFKSLFSFFLILFLISFPLRGEVIEKNRDFRKAIALLEDGLAEIAVGKFALLLSKEGLSSEEKEKISLLLAESLIRDGKAKKALSLLQFLKQHSAQKSFLSAYALFFGGDLEKSAEIFEKIASSSGENREISALQATKIYFTLGKIEKALKIISPLRSHPNKRYSVEAKIISIEIYLFEKKYDKAERILKLLPKKGLKTNLKIAFFQAEINKEKGDLESAIKKYKALSQSKNPPISYLSNIKLSKIYFSQKKQKPALKTLLNFINRYPEYPHPNELFSLLFSPERKWTEAEGKELSLSLKKLKSQKPKANATVYASYYQGSSIRLTSREKALEGEKILESILIQNPQHPLVPYVLLEIAKRDFYLGNKQAALDILQKIDQGKEVSLLGITNLLRGEIKKSEEEFSQAAEYFSKAQSSLSKKLQEKAQIYAGVMYLKSGNLHSFDKLLNQISNEAIQKNLKLRRAFFLANKRNSGAIPLFEEILSEGSLEKENRNQISLALAFLYSLPPHPQKEKIEDLLVKIEKKTLSPKQWEKYLSLRFKIAENSEETIKILNSLEEPLLQTLSPKAKFLIAISQYKLKDFNKARILLEKIATNKEDEKLAEIATFYAAKSSLYIGTPQSRERGMENLEKVIQNKGFLYEEALLEKARLLIDSLQSEKALKTLQRLENSEKQERVSTQMLKAQAFSLKEEKEELQKAIEIYTRLRNHPNKYIVLQALYLKGILFEKIREKKKAVHCYYQIIQSPPRKSQIPKSWEIFYSAGFRIIDLLIEEERFVSAINIAERLAKEETPKKQEVEKVLESLKKKRLEEQQ